MHRLPSDCALENVVSSLFSFRPVDDSRFFFSIFRFLFTESVVGVAGEHDDDRCLQVTRQGTKILVRCRMFSCQRSGSLKTFA